MGSNWGLVVGTDGASLLTPDGGKHWSSVKYASNATSTRTQTVTIGAAAVVFRGSRARAIATSTTTTTTIDGSSRDIEDASGAPMWWGKHMFVSLLISSWPIICYV